MDRMFFFPSAPTFNLKANPSKPEHDNRLQRQPQRAIQARQGKAAPQCQLQIGCVGNRQTKALREGQHSGPSHTHGFRVHLDIESV